MNALDLLANPISQDYKVDAAARYTEALTGDNEFKDIELFAALERGDYKEASRIYEEVFRPYLLKAAEWASSKQAA